MNIKLKHEKHNTRSLDFLFYAHGHKLEAGEYDKYNDCQTKFTNLNVPVNSGDRRLVGKDYQEAASGC